MRRRRGPRSQFNGNDSRRSLRYVLHHLAHGFDGYRLSDPHIHTAVFLVSRWDTCALPIIHTWAPIEPGPQPTYSPQIAAKLRHSSVVHRDNDGWWQPTFPTSHRAPSLAAIPYEYPTLAVAIGLTVDAIAPLNTDQLGEFTAAVLTARINQPADDDATAVQRAAHDYTTLCALIETAVRDGANTLPPGVDDGSDLTLSAVGTSFARGDSPARTSSRLGLSLDTTCQALARLLAPLHHAYRHVERLITNDPGPCPDHDVLAHLIDPDGEVPDCRHCRIERAAHQIALGTRILPARPLPALRTTLLPPLHH